MNSVFLRQFDHWIELFFRIIALLLLALLHLLNNNSNILLQPRLVDTLMTAEKHSHYQNSVNCFRKLLGKLIYILIIWRTVVCSSSCVLKITFVEVICKVTINNFKAVVICNCGNYAHKSLRSKINAWFRYSNCGTKMTVGATSYACEFKMFLICFVNKVTVVTLPSLCEY